PVGARLHRRVTSERLYADAVLELPGELQGSTLALVAILVLAVGDDLPDVLLLAGQRIQTGGRVVAEVEVVIVDLEHRAELVDRFPKNAEAQTLQVPVVAAVVGAGRKTHAARQRIGVDIKERG